MRLAPFIALCISVICLGPASGDEKPASRIYENRLKRIEDPKPLLADYPKYFEPIAELVRYEAPVLVDDEGADLHVRAWRFSYNARGIIEMPNRLRAAETALIMVHPWGIDDCLASGHQTELLEGDQATALIEEIEKAASADGVNPAETLTDPFRLVRAWLHETKSHPHRPLVACYRQRVWVYRNTHWYAVPDKEIRGELACTRASPSRFRSFRTSLLTAAQRSKLYPCRGHAPAARKD